MMKGLRKLLFMLAVATVLIMVSSAMLPVSAMSTEEISQRQACATILSGKDNSQSRFSWGELVYAEAEGVAVQVKNHNIIWQPANLTLLLMVGWYRVPIIGTLYEPVRSSARLHSAPWSDRHFLPVLVSRGRLNINGVVYPIKRGWGFVQIEKHKAFLFCIGIDEAGNRTFLRLYLSYSQESNGVYRFKVSGVFYTANARAILIMNGEARRLRYLINVSL